MIFEFSLDLVSGSIFGNIVKGIIPKIFFIDYEFVLVVSSQTELTRNKRGDR